MAPAVTRAVRVLSTLHGQSPTQKASSIASMTVFSKKHFPKFLGFVCASGFVSGFAFMESLHHKQVSMVLQSVRSDVFFFLAGLYTRTELLTLT